MSEQELLRAMADAYFSASGPSDVSFGLEMAAMRAVLDVLHAAGYRRCAEGQRVTQWCDRAEKAEAEIARLQAYIREREILHAQSLDAAQAEVERLRLYESMASEYGLSVFEDLQELKSELERTRSQDWHR